MTPLSPKDRFLQAKDDASAHAKMVSSALFEKASDLAMLQTQLNLPNAREDAAANSYRLEGARLFLAILMTIGDPRPENPKLPDNSLNYEATKIK
jgi:hypothetical protein